MDIDFTQIFNDFYETLSTKLPNVIVGLIVIIVFIILGKLFYQFIGKRIQRKWDDTIISNFVSEAIKWCFLVLSLR